MEQKNLKPYLILKAIFGNHTTAVIQQFLRKMEMPGNLSQSLIRRKDTSALCGLVILSVRRPSDKRCVPASR